MINKTIQLKERGTTKVEEKMITQRLRLTICGAVQGVGFHPFVYALASRCGLSGFVGNESGGVFVEIEGEKKDLQDFLRGLREDAPPLSHITEITTEEIKIKNDKDFGSNFSQTIFRANRRADHDAHAATTNKSDNGINSGGKPIVNTGINNLI